MGIEHERIHIETSSVLHRQMPLAHIVSSDPFVYCTEHGAAPNNSMVEVAGGVVRLGKDKEVV